MQGDSRPEVSILIPFQIDHIEGQPPKLPPNIGMARDTIKRYLYIVIPHLTQTVQTGGSITTLNPPVVRLTNTQNRSFIKQVPRE
jgi:hypothetical protein